MNKEKLQECLILVNKSIEVLNECASIEQLITNSTGKDNLYARAIILLLEKKERTENLLTEAEKVNTSLV